MPVASLPDPVLDDSAPPGNTPAAAFASLRVLFLILIPALIAVQVLALGVLKTRFWGFHLWSQVAWPVTAGAILLWVMAGFVVWRPGSLGSGAKELVERKDGLLILVVTLAAGAAFWLLRSGQTLLGDGYPISVTLPEGGLSPRLPLTKLIQVAWLAITGPLFAREGVPPETVVRESVASLHVIAGMLYVPVAFGLGRALARGGAGARLAAAVLLLEGSMLLFFGYVEHYSLVALAVAAYLWTALLYLEKRLPLCVPLLLWIAALGLHLMAALLFPSVLFLIVYGLRENRRIAVLRDLGIGGLGIAGVNAILALAFPGFGLQNGIADLFHTAQKDHGGGSGLEYIFSLGHAVDFLNEHFLIGPVGAIFLLPLLGIWLARRGPLTPKVVFLLVAALFVLAAEWVAAEPTLGYARDWDNFAPLASVLVAAVLVLILSLVRSPGERRVLLLSGLMLGVAHLGCWVLLNHSEPRSLARLGLITGQKGRTQVTVGNWYLQRNDDGAAEKWFRRALDDNPGNNDAMNLLGVVLIREGRAGEAIQSFERAVTLRPDKPEYRRDLVRALMENGKYQEALPHLSFLREHDRKEPANWLHSSMALSVLGREEEARKVLAEGMSVFEPALNRPPRDAGTLVDLGFLFAAGGRSEAALDLFHRALSLDPDSDAALLQSVALLAREGRYEEARPLAERFIRLYPKDPESARLREWLDQLPG